MVSASIDHLVSLTIFIAATLLFIGLFNDTIQTAVIYQNHQTIATKASDLLDTILLSPGNPYNWGLTDNGTTSFGVQDPEFTQYRLSPFSLARLTSLTGTPVYYPKTGEYYSNITMDSQSFLLLANNSAIDYSSVAKNLGINSSYGFQLSFTPIVTVEITETHSANPLSFGVNVQGTGFPLVNAEITYCLLAVNMNGGEGSYPAYATSYGVTYTDSKGQASVNFNEITNPADCYALIAYARLGSLVGVGYHERVSSENEYVLPFVDSMSEGRVLIAHSYDVHYFGPPVAEIKYNATFVFLSDDFVLQQIPLENAVGHVNYGDGKPYDVINIPTSNPGILLISYQKSANDGGIVLMPWGISSLAFSVVFGDQSIENKEWIATDMRQVLVGEIAYQAKISVWSLRGYQVNG